MGPVDGTDYKANRAPSSMGYRYIGRVMDSANCFAAAVTVSTVKPNFSAITEAGADAPKRSMLMTRPLSPTYLCQPKATPASIARRLVTFGGSTLSRYDLVCASNTSQLGKLTTRARMLCLASSACAPTASETSEPVAIRMMSG